MNVTLHIERVVLDGLPVSEAGGPHVQAAIETELARLIAVGGVSAALQAGQVLPSIRGGDLQMTAGGSHADMGRQIAGALYGGIGTGDRMTGFRTSTHATEGAYDDAPAG